MLTSLRKAELYLTRVMTDEDLILNNMAPAGQELKAGVHPRQTDNVMKAVVSL